MKSLFKSKTALFFLSLSISLTVLLGFSLYYNFTVERPIKVVDLNMLTQEQALAWATENDIKLEILEAYDENVTIGTILSQGTNVGERIFAGSTITITLSKGPDPDVLVDVIDFEGKDIGDVQTFIDSNKLMSASIKFEKSDEISSAFLIRQSITTGQIKRSDKIDFFISTGDKDTLTTVTVPDFSTYTRQQVSSWGTTSNIKINFIEEFNKDFEQGKVFEQSQAANAKVYDGSSLTVKLSLGTGVVLENFVGKSKSAIDTFINTNGLKVTYTYTYSSQQNKDYGISMSPGASVRVAVDSTVKVTLSLGKITLTNFTGKTLSQLQTWVSEQNKNGANLKLSSSQAYSDSVTSGLLISQTPSSGDINPGTEIKASVSKGGGVTVNTYKGTSNTSVQEGLRLSKVEVYSNIASGTVIDQSIASGTRVDSNTTITLTVSIGKPSVSDFRDQPLSSLQGQINELNGRGANLSLSKSGESYDANISSGKVISNTSGTVNIGASISYTISIGSSVTVGNYVGGTIPSGVNLSFVESGRQYSSSVPANSIISQSIGSGTVVAAGTQISVVISNGPEPLMDLPHLAGLVGESTSFENSSNIIDSFLRSKCITNINISRVSEGVGAGLVVSQSPGPGKISCSTTVSVSISDN